MFSVFTSLQFTVATLPYGLKAMAEGRVAFGRLQRFLQLPEYSHPSQQNEEDDGICIDIKGANLGWPVAADINKESIDRGKQKQGIKCVCLLCVGRPVYFL